MEYTRLGRTGLKVSRLCLGGMTFGWSCDEATSFRILDRAFDSGINFIDTADIYSFWIQGNRGGESESIIGRWLATKPRREVVIATKVRGRMWPGPNGEGLSRAHILQAVDDSLRRLQTDYIDLYQTHYPDDDTPLEETLAALDTLVRAGKVRYIGCSNYPAWLLLKTLWLSDKHHLARFDCLQPHYSLFNRDEFERELAAACDDQGIGVIPYSPLAAGFATGKYTRSNRQPDSTRTGSGLIQKLLNNDQAYVALDVLHDLAQAHSVPVAHIALAWQLAQPVITAPIIGARTLEQLEEVLGATRLHLTAAELSRIDQATKGF
ncbi:MAG: aldo/keto reductase [Anaerolineae bacterium]|jgi:aryl-alcohol dehydrogenase-like predicted oxidoreductase|nr:aldo/keto reductase [Anaerolineae bacterium]